MGVIEKSCMPFDSALGEMGRLGDEETWGWGDLEMGRLGDEEIWRWGDLEMGRVCYGFCI